MPDTDHFFEVLHAVRDLGLGRPAAAELTARVHAAVEREIELEFADSERHVARLHRGRRVPLANSTPIRQIAALTPHVMTAALAAIAVVVAVGAVLLLGNHHHSQVPAGSSAATSHRELLQTLGILRTSPTATDRAVIACAERFAKHPSDGCPRVIPGAVLAAERPDWAVAVARRSPVHPAHPALSIRRELARLGHPRWDLTLIRTVALQGLGVSVRFFPGTWQSSPHSAQRTAGVLATLVLQGRIDPFFQRASVGTLRSHGLALPIFVASPKHPGNNQGAIIVPDGVAKITVGMVSLEGRPSVRWLENVTAAVHDNVAAVQLNTPTFQTKGLGSIAPHATLARLTWFDAQGDIIRRTATAIQLYVNIQHIGPPPKVSR